MRGYIFQAKIWDIAPTMRFENIDFHSCDLMVRWDFNNPELRDKVFVNCTFDHSRLEYMP